VHITKDAQDRPRPSGGLVDAAGSSFPSAHAAYAVAWIAVALVIARTRGVVHTTTAVGAGIVLAVAVGLSRVYLGVHYLSDATAGAGLAAVIFSFCGMVALVLAHLRQNGRQP
jgi:undecaprenyl-diphosphatase